MHDALWNSNSAEVIDNDQVAVKHLSKKQARHLVVYHDTK